MAYLPFPKNWPQFTPKDKLGDWFEAYANIMELNVWMKTTIKSAAYDDAKSEWTVTLTTTATDSGSRILHPRHIIWCTGHSGEPRIPRFPGQNEFKGTVYHGSEHVDAAKDDNVKGKKVVVVGSGNSGHDIAQNFYENGADVTMLQRSGTYVITADKGVFMMHEGLHEDNGYPHPPHPPPPSTLPSSKHTNDKKTPHRPSRHNIRIPPVPHPIRARAALHLKSRKCRIIHSNRSPTSRIRPRLRSRRSRYRARILHQWRRVLHRCWM